TRPLTPQPWHPDYQNAGSRSSISNPLDLPEHRHEREQYSRSDLNLSVIDQDEHYNEKGNNKKGGKNNKNTDNDSNYESSLKKTRKTFFSRIRRTRVKKIASGDGILPGTGRVALFSNERLYLHWIHFGILQGSIALTLLSFGTGIPAYVGAAAILLALLTLIYATTLFHLRHLHMRAKRQDVDYHTKIVPTILCFGLIIFLTCISSNGQDQGPVTLNCGKT
ncbi:hypothetical protein BGZ46_002695, partial [Entomortierella lignicola]